MACYFCNSENVQLLKEGIFTTATYCNYCGNSRIDNYHGSCCGNQLLIDIQFEQKNGAWVQRSACKNCKTLIGGAKKKTDDFNKLPKLSQKQFLHIESLKKESYDKMQVHLKKLSEVFRETQTEEWWAEYNAYLKTDVWQYKRQQVLEREGYQCQGCRISKAVHVHHTTYKNLGDELLFQLVALCKDCHSKLHPEKNL